MGAHVCCLLHVARSMAGVGPAGASCASLVRLCDLPVLQMQTIVVNQRITEIGRLHGAQLKRKLVNTPKRLAEVNPKSAVSWARITRKERVSWMDPGGKTTARKVTPASGPTTDPAIAMLLHGGTMGSNAAGRDEQSLQEEEPNSSSEHGLSAGQLSAKSSNPRYVLPSCRTRALRQCTGSPATFKSNPC